MLLARHGLVWSEGPEDIFVERKLHPVRPATQSCLRGQKILVLLTAAAKTIESSVENSFIAYLGQLLLKILRVSAVPRDAFVVSRSGRRRALLDVREIARPERTGRPTPVEDLAF